MRYISFLTATVVALFASSAGSQTLTTIATFTGTGGTASGDYPAGNLTIGGTTLYGMTGAGGVGGIGNVFSVGTDGTNYRNLLSFTGTNGQHDDSVASLILTGTTLYGMSGEGGVNLGGNVFSIGTDGSTYQNLVSFISGGGGNGYLPGGSLTLAGSRLYGSTSQGGSGKGNVFSVGTDGTSYQNLVSFTGEGGAASGFNPEGSLVLAGTALYGMTYQGGANGIGNVFSVGTNGTSYQNLVSFTGTGGTASGAYPKAGLLLVGTTLYGMTSLGGSDGFGNIFSVGTNGTSYKNLVSFTGEGGAASGDSPTGGLIVAGTTLYGMTPGGGADGEGNIFSVGIDGSDYQDLYDFTGGDDGGAPLGNLTLSDGTLFGMTSGGGTYGDGTVFGLVVPEPGTPALAGTTAAVALVSYRWRRRRGSRAAGLRKRRR